MSTHTSSPAVVWIMATLMVLFSLKHFVADFLLQTDWMALGKERGRGWLSPLAAHVGCHAILTLLIAFAIAPRLWWLAIVDFAIHIAVDRSKTLWNHWGSWTQQDCRYWWLLGLDQLLHQLTNVGLATALLTL